MKERDWASLAWKVGSLGPRGESGGTRYARLALAEILGEDELVDAVHAAIDYGPGSELARSVLVHIKPRRAMEECHNIYRNSTNIEHRQNAVWLLCGIGDAYILKWVDEYLHDPDEIIQVWAAKVLLELTYSEQIDEGDLVKWIEKMEHHLSQEVRELGAQIRQQMETWH